MKNCSFQYNALSFHIRDSVLTLTVSVFSTYLACPVQILQLFTFHDLVSIFPPWKASSFCFDLLYYPVYIPTEFYASFFWPFRDSCPLLNWVNMLIELNLIGRQSVFNWLEWVTTAELHELSWLKWRKVITKWSLGADQHLLASQHEISSNSLLFKSSFVSFMWSWATLGDYI